jgi:hypothetical protein
MARLLEVTVELIPDHMPELLKKAVEKREDGCWAFVTSQSEEEEEDEVPTAFDKAEAIDVHREQRELSSVAILSDSKPSDEDITAREEEERADEEMAASEEAKGVGGEDGTGPVLDSLLGSYRTANTAIVMEGSTMDMAREAESEENKSENLSETVARAEEEDKEFKNPQKKRRISQRARRTLMIPMRMGSSQQPTMQWK